MSKKSPPLPNPPEHEPLESASPPKIPLKKVLGYIRVSTSEQANDGLSLQFQKRKIRAFCDLNDLKLVRILEDPGYSGKNINRPGLQELFSLLKDPNIHGVVVYRLDRLSRSTRDLLEMVDDFFSSNQTSFYSVTEKIDTTTAIGKFFLTIIGALAQMERDLTRERVIAGMEETRMKGTHLGGVPLGFKRQPNKQLEANDEEAPIIERIKDLRNQGLTLRAVADILRQEGHKTKKGGVWHPQTIKLILDRTNDAASPTS